MLNTVTIPLLFTGSFNLLFFVVFCDTVSHLRHKMAYVVFFIQEKRKHILFLRSCYTAVKSNQHICKTIL